MGVCCIVFDIDGMLFEFFMNFSCYFQHFSSRFMLFPTLKKEKKNWCKKKIRGGGGGVLNFFFFYIKTILSHFTFYAIFNIKKNNNNNIEKCPFTYWLNGRWFLQIVDGGQLESISIISSIPLFCFCISNVGWFGGGGGVMFFSHFMLFPTFLEKISENSFLYPLFMLFSTLKK